MILQLRQYGDPILRLKTQAANPADPRLRALARDMIETMHAEEGIGLAAPQVGENMALCVIDVPIEGDRDENGLQLNPAAEMPMVMLNPQILDSSSEHTTFEEGCLSFPGIRAPIERPAEVTVQWTTLDGRTETQRLRALVARCVQHEMDHLEGVLICDRMSKVKRLAQSGKLKRLNRETRAKLGIID
ncbi:MAG: peptide deformylase [Kiritimatiellae bacterium]|nr:peptide deformylase [Kiritimatiellia bacterium]